MVTWGSPILRITMNHHESPIFCNKMEGVCRSTEWIIFPQSNVISTPNPPNCPEHPWTIQFNKCKYVGLDGTWMGLGFYHTPKFDLCYLNLRCFDLFFSRSSRYSRDFPMDGHWMFTFKVPQLAKFLRENIRAAW